ncbi:MAG UNVERIFIED_CONTAM: hypothetical protein LVR18_47310 [Planctomycetaceae bacterium]
MTTTATRESTPTIARPVLPNANRRQDGIRHQHAAPANQIPVSHPRQTRPRPAQSPHLHHPAAEHDAQQIPRLADHAHETTLTTLATTKPASTDVAEDHDGLVPHPARKSATDDQPPTPDAASEKSQVASRQVIAPY